MAIEKRSTISKTDSRSVGEGTYLAKIVSHLDPSFMGALEVTLLREQGNTLGDNSQTYVVRCAMPFFGYTGYEFMGGNSTEDGASTYEAYNDTQKSYGMWFVPPDVGVTVLVTFVDGDPSQGFWIGCIPSNFGNHMVPAIAGSSEVEIDEADKKTYNWPGTGKMPLPVAEANRRLNRSKGKKIDVEKFKKPLHPIAEHFLRQGLIEDDARGTTTSSARREVPSMVFGISTPGPLDRKNGAKRAKIGVNESQTPKPVPVSRLGGTQFVMDDGDDRYQRKTPAGEGPVDYADTQNGEKGNSDIPYNEYVRLRTRTGHQLLMHNSEDLIYIGNSKGTTWIELTSNGKIDIYARDSISIHTENDLNIKADRDINMEAGRNINLKASAEYSNNAQLDSNNFESGRVYIESKWNTKMIAGNNRQITVGSNSDLVVGGSTKITTRGNIDINSGGNHTETATRIDMNGPVAQKATAINPLSTHKNPKTDPTLSWSTKYQTLLVDSIVKRIPMHEPWVLHENQVPTYVDPAETDRERNV